MQIVVRAGDWDLLQVLGTGGMLHKPSKEIQWFFQEVSVEKRRAKGSRVGFLGS